MIVNLPDEIDTKNGEIVIDMTVKLGKRRLSGFPILVGSTGDESNFGLAKFANKDNIRLYANNSMYMINSAIGACNSDSDLSNNIDVKKTYLLLYTDAESYYYDYKFVIDTISQRFRVYHKKTSSTSWSQMYEGINLKEKDSNEFLVLDGAIKTGTLPEKLTSLKFKITESENNTDESDIESVFSFKRINVSKNLPVAKTTDTIIDYSKFSTGDNTAMIGIALENAHTWGSVDTATAIVEDDKQSVLEWSNRNFSQNTFINNKKYM